MKNPPVMALSLMHSLPLKSLAIKNGLNLLSWCMRSTLLCPKCQNEMRIAAIINDQLVVEKILKHLDLWKHQAHSPPVSEETKIIEEVMYDYTFFDYLPA